MSINLAALLTHRRPHSFANLPSVFRHSSTRDERPPSLPSAVHFATRFIFVSPHPLLPSFGKSSLDGKTYIYIFHQGRRDCGNGAQVGAQEARSKGGNGGHRVYKSNRARPLNFHGAHRILSVEYSCGPENGNNFEGESRVKMAPPSILRGRRGLLPFCVFWDD